MKPKKIILCVDDDAAALSIRKIMLETRGYQVRAFAAAEAALASFRQAPADLLLCNLMLRGADGSWLVEKIKTLSPRTPAILLTERMYRQPAIPDALLHARQGVAENATDRTTPQADLLLVKGMHDPAHLLEYIRVLLIKRRSPTRALPHGASAPSASSRIGAA